MKLRKGTASDIDAIIKCYETARQMMRTAGNYSQWINAESSPPEIGDNSTGTLLITPRDPKGNLIEITI